jgi:hypothetical protein
VPRALCAHDRCLTPLCCALLVAFLEVGAGLRCGCDRPPQAQQVNARRSEGVVGLELHWLAYPLQHNTTRSKTPVDLMSLRSLMLILSCGGLQVLATSCVVRRWFVAQVGKVFSLCVVVASERTTRLWLPTSTVLRSGRRALAARRSLCGHGAHDYAGESRLLVNVHRGWNSRLRGCVAVCVGMRQSVGGQVASMCWCQRARERSREEQTLASSTLRCSTVCAQA